MPNSQLVEVEEVQTHRSFFVSAENLTNSIRADQINRGLTPCFRTAERLTCKESGCEWRKNCLKLVASWKR